MIWISTCAAAAMRCQAIRWQRPDTEPAGKSEADKSTKISITGGAPLVVIRTERKAWGEAT